MFKLISKILLITINILYLSILLILPFEWHKLGPHSEIFPAFDLIIIYYLSTHSDVRYWHLFLAGIVLVFLALCGFLFLLGLDSL